MVYKTQNSKDSKAASSTTKTATVTKVTPKTVDPYEGWVDVATADGTVTVKVPKTWAILRCEEGASSVYLASIASQLTKCRSDAVGEVSVTLTNDFKDAYIQKEKTACDTEFSVTQPTLKGIKGYRVARTEAAPNSSDCAMNIEGTKNVTYYFAKSADTYYIFTYKQTPSFTDDLATFEKMVQSAQLN
jgi:hypothetical protein